MTVPHILMGASLSHCLNIMTDCFLQRSYLKHTNVLVDEDEQAEFIQSINTACKQHIDPVDSPKKILSLFSMKKLKQTCKVPVALVLIENTGWPRQHRNYKKLENKNVVTSSDLDNPLQMLDASGLLVNQECVSCTPTSSIDLEWEDEGMPVAIIENEKSQNLDELLSEPAGDNSDLSNLPALSWSKISTPNSLEWDPVDVNNADLETDTLLTEIERLTNRTLDETADWVNSS